MTKILFTDLDGTLLDDAKEIPQANRTAILEALACGHKIVLTTGRATWCAVNLCKSLGLTMDGCFCIAFNGGCIYDMYRQQAIYQKTLPRTYVRHLFDAAHELGVHIHTYYGSEVFAERDTPDLHKYLAATKMDCRIVPDVCTALPGDPCKLLAVNYQDHQALCTYRDAIKNWCQKKADTCFSCRELLEIVPPGVTKGAAVRILCDHLGIPMENTISAGDADNDISMLQATYVSAVMKNADAHMHQYGTYITATDNNQGGVAEIIRRFML